MSVSASYKTYVLHQLQVGGTIVAKSMFGGNALYFEVTAKNWRWPGEAPPPKENVRANLVFSGCSSAHETGCGSLSSDCESRNDCGCH